jgi:mono/diheme cytochrome c family protein
VCQTGNIYDTITGTVTLVRLITLVLVAVLVLGAAAVVIGWRSAIDPVALAPRASFDKALVARGEMLARLGDCLSCHTADDGRAYAGGRALETPFGTVWGTNITPDPDTGIGTWSEAAFRRAMKNGVDRAGDHLYPAFPYEHFAKLTDDDIDALYAYVMTREPVRQATPPTHLPFPYGFRPILALWKLLYLDKEPVSVDSAKTETWNRGAYLVEALAHCGACHTPRNRLGAEESDRPFAGGEAEGWWAPPLDASSPAPEPWTEEALATYLRGWEKQHGGAVGPMAPVVDNLAQVPESEIRAIAVYIASFLPPPTPDRLIRAEALVARAEQTTTPPQAPAAGAAIYAGSCAICHDSGGDIPFTVRSLAQHTALAGPDPRNVVHVVLDGVRPREGAAGAIMPGFRDTLTEAQLSDLVQHLRARFNDAPPWLGVPELVHRLYTPATVP